MMEILMVVDRLRVFGANGEYFDGWAVDVLGQDKRRSTRSTAAVRHQVVSVPRPRPTSIDLANLSRSIVVNPERFERLLTDRIG